MKRILFYSLLLVQAIVILLIFVQHNLIGVYGTEIKLLRDGAYTSTQSYDNQYDTIYIDYEINSLSDEIWEIEEELNYDEKIYVVLEPNESEIHQGVRVTRKKPEVISNQVILPGRYISSNAAENEHFVNYDIEKVNNYDEQYKLESGKQWIITIKVAPWGQKAIVDIENE